MKSTPKELPVITPRLVVENAADAIEFYKATFGAEEVERFDTPDGSIVHAALAIRGEVFSLTESNPSNDHQTPLDLGGSPILLTLICEDPDAAAAKAKANGAEIVIPIEDRYYGYREGRIRDPHGHLWILSKPTQKLTDQEIQIAVNNNEK